MHGLLGASGTAERARVPGVTVAPRGLQRGRPPQACQGGSKQSRLQPAAGKQGRGRGALRQSSSTGLEKAGLKTLHGVTCLEVLVLLCVVFFFIFFFCSMNKRRSICCCLHLLCANRSVPSSAAWTQQGAFHAPGPAPPEHRGARSCAGGQRGTSPTAQQGQWDVLPAWGPAHPALYPGYRSQSCPSTGGSGAGSTPGQQHPAPLPSPRGVLGLGAPAATPGPAPGTPAHQHRPRSAAPGFDRSMTMFYTRSRG